MVNIEKYEQIMKRKNKQNPTRKQTEPVNVNKHFLQKHFPEGDLRALTFNNSLISTVLE